MKPYNQEDSKKEQVRDMFDNIAPTYDRLNHILSINIDRLWRRRVVRIVRRLHPGHILDVATGTGDLAIAMARKITDCKIHGVDLSEQMLAIAREKVAARGMSERISLSVGDAEHLDVADGSVDVATVAFGVRNFEHQHKALTEMKRTIRKGGHLIVLEFSNPRCALVRWVYRLYSHYILPAIGRLVSKHATAYTYLPDSIDKFASPEEFTTLLKEVGFDHIERRSQSMGIAHIYIAHKA